MEIKIAIVEDEQPQASLLHSYLDRYARENDLTLQIKVFSNPLTFLEPYVPGYDLVFMDIRMPYMNGMDTARRLRELDDRVLLIFITNLIQYAVSGYEVDALDYIVKPVNYFDFALKFRRAVGRIPKETGSKLTITCDVGLVTLDTQNIEYIESVGHHVVYHTFNGQYTQYNSLKNLESTLEKQGFFRCNSCYLVNLKYVTAIKGYQVQLSTCTLKISQHRKKQFLTDLAAFHEKNR